MDHDAGLLITGREARKECEQAERRFKGDVEKILKPESERFKPDMKCEEEIGRIEKLLE